MVFIVLSHIIKPIKENKVHSALQYKLYQFINCLLNSPSIIQSSFSEL